MAAVSSMMDLHSRSASRRRPCQAFHANQLACSSAALCSSPWCFDRSGLSFGPKRGRLGCGLLDEAASAPRLPQRACPFVA